MEKLFEIKTKYTLEEHLKFNYALVFNKKEISIIIILCLLLVVYGFFYQSIYWIIFAILFPIIFFVSIRYTAKANYKSNKAIADAEIILEFYKNSIVQKTDVGSYTIEHDKINKIIETKTHFYIMIAKNQGVIIPKEGLPDGLVDYIKNIKVWVSEFWDTN